jgi:hypothetical protein
LRKWIEEETIGWTRAFNECNKENFPYQAGKFEGRLESLNSLEEEINKL